MLKTILNYKYFNYIISAIFALLVILYLAHSTFSIQSKVMKAERSDIVDIYKLYKKIFNKTKLKSYLVENEMYEDTEEFINEYKQITPYAPNIENKKISKYNLTIKAFENVYLHPVIKKRVDELQQSDYMIKYQEENITLFGKVESGKYVLITKSVQISEYISSLVHNFFIFFAAILVIFIVVIALSYQEKHSHKRRRDELEKEFKNLEDDAKKIAFVDTLTGVSTRIKFSQSLNDLMETSKRFRHQFSLVMFDIDNFKKVNDTLGHDYGDLVLKTVAQSVKENIRVTDIVARWGGEEFVVLLPMTHLDNAVTISQKLCFEISKLKFDKLPNVTCSFGVVEYEIGESDEELLKRVDILLYKAKNEGKNCVRYKG